MVDTLASHLVTGTVQVLLRSVTYCQVSLRSPRFTKFYKVGHLRRGCRGRLFECLKIFPGVHGSHGEIRLSISFPHCHPEHSVNGGLGIYKLKKNGHLA